MREIALNALYMTFTQRHLKEVVMKKLLIALMISSAVPAIASAATPSNETSISFVRHGGIRDWRADGNKTLYIEGRSNQWYRAELMSPCHGLNFATGIRFISEPNDSFDRFSKILVDGHVCHVTSLTKSEKPVRQ